MSTDSVVIVGTGVAGATAALTPTNTSLALNTAAWSHDADADV